MKHSSLSYQADAILIFADCLAMKQLVAKLSEGIWAVCQLQHMLELLCFVLYHHASFHARSTLRLCATCENAVTPTTNHKTEWSHTKAHDMIDQPCWSRSSTLEASSNQCRGSVYRNFCLTICGRKSKIGLWSGDHRWKEITLAYEQHAFICLLFYF